MEYIIEDTKTPNGVRYIPLEEDIAECFKRILKNRKKVKVEPMIDGVCGFLYLDKNKMPIRKTLKKHLPQKRRQPP
ncbi:MAG: hypothetical protein ACRC3H_20085 [Lachnospiraceae bacterium]